MRISLLTNITFRCANGQKDAKINCFRNGPKITTSNITITKVLLEPGHSVTLSSSISQCEVNKVLCWVPSSLSQFCLEYSLSPSLFAYSPCKRPTIQQRSPIFVALVGNYKRNPRYRSSLIKPLCSGLKMKNIKFKYDPRTLRHRGKARHNVIITYQEGSDYEIRRLSLSRADFGA